MTRIALFQATSGINPAANARSVSSAAEEAAAGGAEILFTPEMTNLVDRDRGRAGGSIRTEAEDETLIAATDAARDYKIWLHLGSLALREGERWVNRSILVDAEGDIRARYDKVHLFDVDLPTGESWRESRAYAPGQSIVRAPNTPVGRMGLSICYDLRFGGFYDRLAVEGLVDTITVPAAFTVPTGKAHWSPLLRARAIESACFVIAAAQVGVHEDGRETYGHSMVIDPWGEVLLDMGSGSGVGFVDVDIRRVAEVRASIPKHDHRVESTSLSIDDGSD